MRRQENEKLGTAPEWRQSRIGRLDGGPITGMESRIASSAVAPI
jgi:hypothetical protein